MIRFDVGVVRPWAVSGDVVRRPQGEASVNTSPGHDRHSFRWKKR